MIPAIVLAAGRSSRFGQPKALLTDRDGRTFTARVLATLADAGVDGAVVVTRAGDEALTAEIERAAPFARAVVNPDPDRGQLSSLLAGLAAVDRPGVRAALVTLVDVPLVSADTVRRLLAVARTGGAPIVRPVHGGRHGHPVIFARSLFDDLRAADPTAGAKAVVHRHRDAVCDVAVADAGCVEDVDTRADYTRLFGAR
jgi:molybdenum cofactor cytidylyltransferase